MDTMLQDKIVEEIIGRRNCLWDLIHDNLLPKLEKLDLRNDGAIQDINRIVDILNKYGQIKISIPRDGNYLQAPIELKTLLEAAEKEMESFMNKYPYLFINNKIQ